MLFYIIDNNTPGANQYKLEELMKGTGSIFNSKFHSSPSSTISMRFMDPYSRVMETPGPGAYQSFSEFGIYRSKNADLVEKKEIYGNNYKFLNKSASSDNFMPSRSINQKNKNYKKSKNNGSMSTINISNAQGNNSDRVFNDSGVVNEGHNSLDKEDNTLFVERSNQDNKDKDDSKQIEEKKTNNKQSEDSKSNKEMNNNNSNNNIDKQTEDNKSYKSSKGNKKSEINKSNDDNKSNKSNKDNSKQIEDNKSNKENKENKQTEDNKSKEDKNKEFEDEL